MKEEKQIIKPLHALMDIAILGLLFTLILGAVRVSELSWNVVFNALIWVGVNGAIGILISSWVSVKVPELKEWLLYAPLKLLSFIAVSLWPVILTMYLLNRSELN